MPLQYIVKVPINRRWIFASAAVLGWLGTGLSILYDAFYSPHAVSSATGLFGNYQAGVVGSLSRVADDLSYFTDWSNIAIAVVWTLLFLNPDRDTPLFRAARNTALLMITITGLLYALLIASTEHITGAFHLFTNTMEHYINPPLAILVWLVAGPHGWFRWRDLWKIYPVPAVYLLYTLVRGSITHTYPYDFFNVVQHGLGNVLISMVTIVGEATAIAALFIGVDYLRSPRRAS